jgi:hypothetical protein
MTFVGLKRPQPLSAQQNRKFSAGYSPLNSSPRLFRIGIGLDRADRLRVRRTVCCLDPAAAQRLI